MRAAHSMIESSARPIKMSKTMVTPMSSEPMVEKSWRNSSPNSSPTPPPSATAPKALLVGMST